MGPLLRTLTTDLTDLDVQMACALEAYGRGEMTRRARLRASQEAEAAQARSKRAKKAATTATTRRGSRTRPTACSRPRRRLTAALSRRHCHPCPRHLHRCHRTHHHHRYPLLRRCRRHVLDATAASTDAKRPPLPSPAGRALAAAAHTVASSAVALATISAPAGPSPPAPTPRAAAPTSPPPIPRPPPLSPQPSAGCP